MKKAIINFHLVEYDLIDLGSSIRLLQKTEATVVYDLAAQSFVAVSFENPTTTAKITGLGQRQHLWQCHGRCPERGYAA